MSPEQCHLRATGSDATLTLRRPQYHLEHRCITSTSNKLHITWNSDSDASGSGAVSVNYATLNSNNGNITIGGGADPSTGYAWGNSDIPQGPWIEAFSPQAAAISVCAVAASMMQASAIFMESLSGTFPPFQRPAEPSA